MATSEYIDGNDGLVIRVDAATGHSISYYPDANTDASRGSCLASAFEDIASGDSVTIYTGNYLISSALAVPSGCTVTLAGCRIYHTSYTSDIFTLSSASNVSISGCGILEGAGKAAGGIGNEAGIRTTGTCDNLRIDGITLKNFRGAGLALYSYSAGALHTNGCISNVTCFSNNWGMYFSGGSEFWTVTNCQFNSNNTGLFDQGGNLAVSNCVITDNGTGIYLESGGNHAHGSIIGCHIDHNTAYSVYVNAVTLGMTFSGCHFYPSGGKIYLKDCQGISFSGGHMSSGTTIEMNGTFTGNNVVDSVYFPSGDPTVTATAPQRLKLIFRNCWSNSSISSILNQ